MNKQEITQPKRSENFDTGAYSDAILINGFLFVSGQASVDFETSQFVLGTIEEETQKTIENIQSILKAAGGSINDIIKMNAYLSDIDDFESFNKVYSEYFIGMKPARTTVGSNLAEGIKVEIDCIAKISS